MKRLSFVKGALVAACVATTPSFADTPVVAYVDPVLSEARGSITRMSGWIDVTNPERVDLRAQARSFVSPFGYAVEFPAESILVPGGERVRLPFSMTIRTDGAYHVVLPVDLLGPRGALVERVNGTLDLLVRDGVYSVERYDKLFVQPVDHELNEDGIEVLSFRAAPPDTSIALSDDYTRERWPVEALEIVTDDAVRDINPGTGTEAQSPTLPLPPPRDTSTLPRHRDPEDERFTQEAVDERIRRAIEAEGGSVPASLLPGGMQKLGDDGVATGVTAMGSFHYTGLDNKLHPAWGWRVYAFVDMGFITLTVGKTNVGTNGNWSMALPKLPTAYNVKFTYEPRNVYFTLRNTSGAYYSFSSGAKHTLADNKVLNEYTQAAYLGSSDLVGLGEVHRDGMDFWEALKTKGEGIDPVPSKSISLYYPNMDYDCGDGTGKAWSCASSDGEIWIIPAHAQGAVLKHELGHQLQNKYWGGKKPDGAGGSHKALKCYNSGLALSEGFATFMQVWSSLDRNQNPSANGFPEIENPVSACTTKNNNERWVTANFWDFYDTLSDSADTIYYVHTGATPKLYLLNGKHDSMAEYLSLFKNLASSQHQTIVGNIFTQNHQ
ncbi:hypothetical protein P2318_04380 [Myxococcaceae bacterium GXIMD 01537]